MAWVELFKKGDPVSNVRNKLLDGRYVAGGEALARSDKIIEEYIERYITDKESHIDWIMRQ